MNSCSFFSRSALSLFSALFFALLRCFFRLHTRRRESAQKAQAPTSACPSLCLTSINTASTNSGIHCMGLFSIYCTKEYEILRSPGSGASLLKTGQVNNYCAMRSICLSNGTFSTTFLPLYHGHSRFHQMYFPPSSPQDIVDSTRCIFLMGV
jgi:hypothetical protein